MEPNTRLDEFRQRVEHLARTATVTIDGKTHFLEDCLLMSFGEIADVVREPGSKIVHAAEQSGKSWLIAAMCIVSMLDGRPSFVCVGDTISNVQEMVDKKLNRVFGHLGISFVWVKNFENLGDMFYRNQEALDKVRSGRIVCVAQANSYQVKAYGNFVRFVAGIDTECITLVLDEVDSMWTNMVGGAGENADDSNKQGSTCKEQELYTLMSGFANGKIRPKGAAGQQQQLPCIVRTVVHLSATHMATLWWHNFMEIGFKGFVVSRDKLRREGVILPCNLRPMRVPNAAKTKLYMISSCGDESEYGLGTREFRIFLDAFLDTNGLSGGHHPKRIMQVSCTPFTKSKKRFTCMDAARKILHDAGKRPVAVLVVTGEGVRLFDNVDLSDNDGKVMKADSGAALAVSDVIRDRGPEYASRNAPLVVVGYHCTSRGVTINTDQWVITHMVVLPRQGLTTANLEQMTMRCGGRNKRALLDNGYVDPETGEPYVTVLMKFTDLETVRKLPDLTSGIILQGGTGDLADLRECMERVLPKEYRKTVKNKRRSCKRSLRFDEHISLSNSSSGAADESDQEESASLTYEEAFEKEKLPSYLTCLLSAWRFAEGKEGTVVTTRDIENGSSLSSLARKGLAFNVPGRRGSYKLSPHGMDVARGLAEREELKAALVADEESKCGV